MILLKNTTIFDICHNVPNYHEPRKKKHVLRGNNKLIITKPLPQDAMEGTPY